MNALEVALVAGLSIIVLILLVLIIIRARRKSKLHIPVPSPQEPEYRLLICITYTRDREVVVLGYVLFTYKDMALYEGLDPVRRLTGVSSHRTVTTPLMNIVEAAGTQKFFVGAQRPDEQVNDEVPVCLEHDAVLYYRENGTLAACTYAQGLKRTTKPQIKHSTTELTKGSLNSLKTQIRIAGFRSLLPSLPPR